MSTSIDNGKRPGTRDDAPGPGAGAGECLHELVEDQTSRTPNAVAIRCGAAELTYVELNRRANLLALRLRSSGLDPEIPVGILLGRSVELVVAILGVMKAGGFYLPIDVATPEERLRFMLDDARVKLLIAAPEQGSLVRAIAGRTIVPVGDGTAPDSPAENPSGGSSPDQPAYLIYTSGSTGKPKGVIVLHRGLTNYVTWAASAYRVAEGSGALVHGSPAFDLVLTGLLCPLVVGRTVDLLPEGGGPERLAEALMGGRDYSLVKLTPAHLEILRTIIPPEASANLTRFFIVGGEPLDGKLVNDWRARAPGTRIVNEYGPTETVVGCCAYFIPPTGALPASIPIGTPIAETRMYVLDESLRQVPPGTIGELFIGGVGVANGYLYRPDLTRERFLEDPFSPGGRMYRSGDLARVEPDGTFVFLGRNDDQVKIRGFRVEPAEIESNLRDHASLRDAVVLSRDEGDRDVSLIAYVVPARDTDVSASDLRRFLGSRLPEYMIPSGFVSTEAIPLTPNGKIDRRLLARVVPRRLMGERNFVEPQTRVERVLASWWEDILGVDRVGTGDSFFDLGGHSLLVAQVIARTSETYGVRVPYREMFDHPTLASLASYIQWGLEHPGPGVVARIRPGPRPSRIPLSYPQEAVWFLLQLQPGNIAYNAQTILRFSGRLDAGALERSLSELVRRHEILRTSIHPDTEGPVQVVHTAVPYALPIVELEGKDEEAREADLTRRVSGEARRPFDTAAFPLIRCVLFRKNPLDHVFLLVEHHFVHDGWSVNLFLGELRDLYAAFVSGSESPLPPLPLQFADYALWQREWMVGDEASRQLAYWKKRLAGVPPVQEMPSDRPRPDIQNFEGASFRHELPEELCELLRSFSRREGVSLFMTMLGTFMTMLHRYGGGDDICVGSGMGNRTTPDLEKLLGMFVNTVAMRLDFSDDPTVRDMLHRSREMCLDAYAHQSVPFEKVVEAVRPQRSPRHTPLYQVLFGFHDSPIKELEFPGLRTELHDTVGNGTAKVDLNVIVIPRSEQHTRTRTRGVSRGITLKWEYDTSLYDERTMRRMVAHFEELLRGVVSVPEARVSGLRLLPEAELGRMVEEWGGTEGTYPRGAGIVRVFAEVARGRGGATALSCGGVTMSYGELDRRSAQCARYLRGRGVRPGSVVGLSVERSFELIVGMLGILKAGGAYCPLEESNPDARLASMMKEGRVSTVVTMSSQAGRLRSLGAEVVCLDSGWGEIGREEETDPVAEVTGSSLAYAMYTSGSTGQPKCVGIPHDAVVRLVRGVTYVHLGPEEVLLQYAPASFDASTFEIWGALLNGGKLVIMPAGRYSLEEVGGVVQSEGVTTLWLTAALFHHMVDGPVEFFGGVRQLLAGGEVLSVGHVQKFARRYPGCTVINGYGPTENTTFTCCYTVKDPEGLGGSVPIGRPVNATHVYILDGHLQPVPVGVPGELYIGGDGLATGYLHQPSLTAERFVADPYRPGERMYRSGDRVRYLADGNIEFLGRMDAQVKLRGYRIEPGEIETVLAEEATVKESVVLVREETSGEKSLVAYLTARPGRTIVREAVEKFARSRLPEYMVPAGWVVLGRFPVTPNGKIDRNSLPAPRPVPPSGDGRPLTSSIEKKIAEIWRVLLGGTEVGAEDDFFALGGHSLLAMQFVTRMKATWDVRIRLADVFRHPTVHALALLIEDQLVKKMETMSLEEIARWMV